MTGARHREKNPDPLEVRIITFGISQEFFQLYVPLLLFCDICSGPFNLMLKSYKAKFQ